MNTLTMNHKGVTVSICSFYAQYKSKAQILEFPINSHALIIIYSTIPLFALEM